MQSPLFRSFLVVEDNPSSSIPDVEKKNEKLGDILVSTDRSYDKWIYVSRENFDFLSIRQISTQRARKVMTSLLNFFYLFCNILHMRFHANIGRLRVY